VVIAALAFGCGGGGTATNEPTTAKEKQALEAQNDPDGEPTAGKKWGGWRYKGERDACFFVVGSRCFKTENAACQAAKCKSPKKCAAAGAAPAQVSCT
jgi:hypothetical protein